MAPSSWWWGASRSLPCWVRWPPCGSHSGGRVPMWFSEPCWGWSGWRSWRIDGIILMVVGSIAQFALLGSLATMRQPQRGASPDVVLGAMLGMVGLAFLADMVIGCTYEAFFVSSSLRATPGKLALELRVVRPNGAQLGLGRAAGRYFAKRLNLLTAGIGYIMAGFDSERRGLHDLICDTRVVRRQS